MPGRTCCVLPFGQPHRGQSWGCRALPILAHDGRARRPLPPARDPDRDRDLPRHRVDALADLAHEGRPALDRDRCLSRHRAQPAVDWLMRHGVKRRGGAVAIVFLGALAPHRGHRRHLRADARQRGERLRQGGSRVRRRPHKGRGPLGFLERDYQIVERIREAIEKSGVGGVLGLSSTAVGVAKGVVTAVVAILTITFLTLFMLLEGPDLGGAGLRPRPRTARDARAADRQRGVPRDRRVRGRQPRDQPRRRRCDGDRPDHPGRAVRLRARR